MKEPSKQSVTRRKFLKMGGVGVAAAAVLPLLGGPVNAQSAIAGKRLGMVIDLQACTACGACIIACKSENNVQTGAAWASKISETVGRFPNVGFQYIPTLCNHCENAACINACPTGAMHKMDGDITMHDPGKCIGCRYCMSACPYGVISYNAEETHNFWRSDKILIEGITSSAEEVTQKVGGTVLPHYNPDRENSLPGMGLRRKGIVEKCTLCDHRVTNGQLPYCVESCPANARIFGDLNDPNSEVNQILSKYRAWRLKEEFGTEPKVFYVRSFNPNSYQKTKGSI